MEKKRGERREEREERREEMREEREEKREKDIDMREKHFISALTGDPSGNLLDHRRMLTN